MPGIREEMMAFVLAVVSGLIVRLVYQCISSFRKVVKHNRLAVELEDLMYWIGVALYLFVQIYHTSDGSVRWHFVLGIVLGAVLMTVFLWKAEKVRKKIYRKRHKDFSGKA